MELVDLLALLQRLLLLFLGETLESSLAVLLFLLQLLDPLSHTLE